MFCCLSDGSAGSPRLLPWLCLQKRVSHVCHSSHQRAKLSPRMGVKASLPKVLLTAGPLQAPVQTLLPTRFSLVLKPLEHPRGSLQPEAGSPTCHLQTITGEDCSSTQYRMNVPSVVLLPFLTQSPHCSSALIPPQCL